MINKQHLLQEFLELLQIKCSTRQEREVADLLTKKLQALGCAVVEDDAAGKIGGNAGNIIATFKGDSSYPAIMLAAHMDCVEPCANVKPLLADGVIKSDGTTILGADDKAGVAAILATLRALKEHDLPHGDLQVVFTVAEEGGLNGSKNIDTSLLTAKSGYVLDSSGRPGKIIIEAPGQHKLTIKIHGKTAHAGIAPENGINAIILAAHALAKTPQGRIDEETTCNIGLINGGNATNIVPDYVEITCETRSRNQAKLDKLTNDIVAVFKTTISQQGGECEVDITKNYAPYALDKNNPVITTAVTAAQKLGLQVELTGTGGGSDANFFNKYGINCSVLGIGMQKVHTTEEFIIEQDLYDIAALTLQIVQDTARLL